MKSVLMRCFALLGAILTAEAQISLSDSGGYKGVRIVVADSVQQHRGFFSALERLLRNASRLLHESTDGLAYLEEVTIVIPSKWRMPNVVYVNSTMTFSEADIRIDSANPLFKDNPYTVQSGSCGENGKYIHLTKDFIMSIAEKKNEAFGDNLGRQFLHEWAHYRYGVFEEHGEFGNHIYPPVYLDGDSYHPMSCKEDAPGYLVNENGDECSIDDLQLNNCAFVMDESQAKMTASIMYKPALKSVNQFCDDTAQNGHNSVAPSRQNFMCNYRSTWSVIHGSDDFKGRHAKKLNDTKLKIIQISPYARPNFVILVDISKGQSTMPLTTLPFVKKTFARFLAYSVPHHSQVGIAKYSTFTKTVNKLTIINAISRMALIKSLTRLSLWNTFGAMPHYEAGLRQAIKVLSLDGQSPEGGTIFFLVNDVDKFRLKIENIMRYAVKHKVMIKFIGLRREELIPREQLPLFTSTRFTVMNYRQEDEDEIGMVGLQQMLVASMQGQVNLENADIPLAVETIEEITPREVIVDGSVGSFTRFTIGNFKVALTIVTYLVSPNNTNYTENSKYFTQRQDLKTKTYLIPYAEEGKWKIMLESRHRLPAYLLSLTVTSRKKDKHSNPIMANCWLSKNVVTWTMAELPLRAFCQVQKGYYPVIGAEVSATSSLSQSVKAKMYDDGSGADNKKDDGIYSAYVYNILSVMESCQIFGTIKNEGNASIVTGKRAGPKLKKRSGQRSATEFPINSLKRRSKSYKRARSSKMTSKPAEHFQRSVVIGPVLIFLNQYPVSSKPEPISDLTVTRIFKISSFIYRVNLKWTSTGSRLQDPLSQQVEFGAELDLRYSTSRSALTIDFKNCPRLTGRLREPLLAKPAHEVQTGDFELIHDSDELSLYFALKLIRYPPSLRSVKPEMSNIAGVLLTDRVLSPRPRATRSHTWRPLARSWPQSKFTMQMIRPLMEVSGSKLSTGTTHSHKTEHVAKSRTPDTEAMTVYDVVGSTEELRTADWEAQSTSECPITDKK